MAARAQLPSISTVPIWGDDGGGGPTPPSGTDRFEASILIGNVPNGDPATAQAAPFRYIGDTGNGAAIETALAAALSSGDPTRIFLRPGTYDFGAGSVTLPLTVPPGCTLEGSGEGVTILVGTATDRVVLEEDVGAQIRGFSIELPSADSATATGDRVVRLAESAVAERVTITVGDGTGLQDDDSLRACFDHQGLHSRVLDCLAIVLDPMADPTDSPRIAYAGIGPRTSGPAVGDTLTRLRGQGLGELVFVGALVSSFELDIQGICAAAGTINGTQGQGRIQATVQVGAAARSGSLQLAGQGHQFDIAIYDGDSASIDGYVTCSSSRSTFRVALEGAGVDGTIEDTGVSNTWSGSLDSTVAAEVVIDGEVIAAVGMRVTGVSGGDITLGAASLNCLVTANRISGVVDNTAGGTGNQIDNNLEGV